MNVIKKLENMNMYQLQKICQKVNVSCPKTKRNTIQALLKPLKMKYNMTVNEKMLQDLYKYRDQKKKLQTLQKKSVRKGVNKKQKCYREIQNVNEIHNKIQRDIRLKNLVSKRRHKLLKYKTKILTDCLQDKKSSNVRLDLKFL